MVHEKSTKPCSSTPSPVYELWQPAPPAAPGSPEKPATTPTPLSCPCPKAAAWSAGEAAGEAVKSSVCAQTHQRGGRVSSSPPLPSCPSCPRLCLQVALDVPWMDIQPTDMNLLLLCTPHHPGHRADRSRHGLHPPGAHCPAVVMEKKSTIQSTDDNPCVPDASLGTGGTEMNRTASSSCPQGAVF